MSKEKMLVTDDPKNYYRETVETQRKILEWISGNLIEHGGSWRSSYELKHIYENQCGGYINNGSMKQALRISGFKVDDDSKSSWDFKVSKKSPALIKFYKLHKR